MEKTTTRFVPATYTLMMVREALADGIDLLNDSSFTLQDIESKELIPFELSIEVMGRYTDWNDDPDWGFRFGERLGIATHGPLGFCALSAPDVRTGLGALARYIQTRAFHLRCAIEDEPGNADALRITFNLDPSVDRYSVRMCETLAMVFQAYLTTVGASPAPTLWRFPFSAPAHGNIYGHFLQGGYSFDHERFEFVVPGSVAMMISPFHNEVSFDTARAQCEAMLATLQPTVPSQVEAILAAALSSRAAEPVPVTRLPGVDEVAGRLDISKRTLIRKLGAAGTSFQAIKDHVLRARIPDALGSAEPIQEVADRMGYGDAGNFTRACHRLFGKSPSELRTAVPKN